MTTNTLPTAALSSLVPLLASPTNRPATSSVVSDFALSHDLLERMREIARRKPNPPAGRTVTLERIYQKRDELCVLGHEWRRVEPTADTPPLVPGSAEFIRRNKRRFELIQKRVRHGLAADEEAEFQQLQAEIFRVT